MINRVIISGGLGNQMFQYAFAKALRHKGIPTKIDISLFNHIKMHNGYELYRIFGINEDLIDKKGLFLIVLRIILRFKPTWLVKTDTIKYDPKNLLSRKRYFSGVWLSELYFKEIEADIRNTYKFKNIDPLNEELALKMKNCNSVSVHIRRGDYAECGISLLGFRYYISAISIINDKVSNPKFYFFSDDITVAKDIAEQMNVDYTIISHNQGEKSYQDMFLMSQCKYNIIANSSFSWWGAWLNTFHDKIVISPKKWVESDDLHNPQLDSWILI